MPEELRSSAAPLLRQAYVMLTGGVSSGIGKGTLAAVLGRMLRRLLPKVDYRKLEPCLQGRIGDMPNTAFGEIIVANSGETFDADVARAAFYIPGYEPTTTSDLSLGRALAAFLEKSFEQALPAPRLGQVATVYRDLVSTEADTTVVEIGGTAGEPEHGTVVNLLTKALGPPVLHLHLTGVAYTCDRRLTTKPAQTCLAALSVAPDVVLVRGPCDPGDLNTIRLSSPGRPITARVNEAPLWPERAYYDALRGEELAGCWRAVVGAEAPRLALFEGHDADAAPAHDVVVVHDGAGPQGYTCLVNRLHAWSRGRIRVAFQEEGTLHGVPDGVVRIGEKAPSRVNVSPLVPSLNIVPCENDSDARAYRARPDWHGTADHPTGAVNDFVRAVVAERVSGARPASVYGDREFAEAYMQASSSGALRDHLALDDVVTRTLSRMPGYPAMRVLDVGCGDGRWSAELIEAGAREVVGVEPAGALAEAVISRRLPDFRLIKARIEDADLRGEFDLVLAMMSLDHVEELGPVLVKLQSHMAAGGRLVVTTEHPLRTAPLSGPRWIQEESRRVSRVCDYGTPGARRYHRFGHPTPVVVYHRPFGGWVRSIVEAGLELVEVHEPTDRDPNDGGNPRFWMLVARKPTSPAVLTSRAGPVSPRSSSAS